jgi:hypothetical protein
MIVRRDPAALVLITQPDHARLAADIMNSCAGLAAHPRRATILLAIAEHDTGWAVEDAAPRVNAATGEVFDFIAAPFSVRQGVWPRCVDLIAPRDPYAGALIAQHAITVYDRMRTHPEWMGFFDDMAVRRDALLQRVDAPLAQLVDDYAFVRLADLISLTFCTQSTDLSQFGAWRVARDGDDVVIDPDIFDGACVPVAVSARRIENRRWSSDAELQAATRDAEIAILRGMVRGPVRLAR